jgi:hypothetical protein
MRERNLKEKENGQKNKGIDNKGNKRMVES